MDLMHGLGRTSPFNGVVLARLMTHLPVIMGAATPTPVMVWPEMEMDKFVIALTDPAQPGNLDRFGVSNCLMRYRLNLNGEDDNDIIQAVG
eukprot:8750473-Heterocapsa_arctica.AAC.1